MFWLDEENQAATTYLQKNFVTREEADKYRIMLLDLLAVIHRDGGHKTQEAGIALAHEQALRLSAERIVEAKELATLTAERDRLQRIIDSRPAINAGLPATYIEWSQSIYIMEIAHAQGDAQ